MKKIAVLAAAPLLMAACGAPSLSSNSGESAPEPAPVPSSVATVTSSQDVAGTSYQSYAIYMDSPDGRKIPCILVQSYYGPALSCDWGAR